VRAHRDFGTAPVIPGWGALSLPFSNRQLMYDWKRMPVSAGPGIDAVGTCAADRDAQGVSQIRCAALERISGAEERYPAASWLVDQLADAISAVGKIRARAVVALRDEENLSLAQLGKRLGLSKARAADIIRDITRTSPTGQPELKPVVSVIVTSREGVLAVRRREKSLYWTFPSGEIGPGETPAEAGVRETMEETGLDIVPGGILGRRVHPQTGRQVVYLAARPAKHADMQSIAIGEDQELDDVCWVSRASIDEQMPDAHHPVLAYLGPRP
jgi:8-oxo-dGTP diphosphatase